MRHFISTAFGFCLAAASMANAQSTTSTPVVVVELFTSQGCSSCPAADDFLAQLAQNPQIMPLALHVDYWDYIGWADSFADPKFTERQKAYAHAIGARMIYTPQMIVGGLDQAEGNQPEKVESLIRKHLKLTQGVMLGVTRRGDQLVIEATAQGPIKGPVRVQLVRFREEATVTIERGENAGRTITYHNIVTSWQPLGDWTGEAPLSIEAKAAGSDPAVVILQSPGPAAILAAARID